MKNYKYTFLLPAYKAAYLEEALVSIRNQTFKDFKVLVSDDYSPENLEIIFKKIGGVTTIASLIAVMKRTWAARVWFHIGIF